MEIIPNPINQIPNPPKQENPKIRIFLTTLGFLVVSGIISTICVYFILGFLIAAAWGGETKLAGIAITILLLLIIHIVIEIRWYRKIIRKYGNHNSKLLVFIPIIIILLPILAYQGIPAYLNYKSDKAVENIENKFADCQKIINQIVKITGVTEENHKAGEKTINLKVSFETTEPISVIASGSLVDEKNTEIFAVLKPGTDSFGIGQHEIDVEFEMLGEHMGYSWGWEEPPKSFLVKKLSLGAGSEGLCEYGGDIILNQPYKTKEYTRSDFYETPNEMVLYAERNFNLGKIDNLALDVRESNGKIKEILIKGNSITLTNKNGIPSVIHGLSMLKNARVFFGHLHASEAPLVEATKASIINENQVSVIPPTQETINRNIYFYIPENNALIQVGHYYMTWQAQSRR